MRNDTPFHIRFFSTWVGNDTLSIFNFFGSIFGNYAVYSDGPNIPDVLNTQLVIVCLNIVYTLGKGLYSKASPTFLHTSLKHTLSCGGLLSSHKAVGFCAFSFLWLVCN